MLKNPKQIKIIIQAILQTLSNIKLNELKFLYSDTKIGIEGKAQCRRNNS